MSDWQVRLNLYEMQPASVSKAQWNGKISTLCKVIDELDDFTYYLCLEAENTPPIFFTPLLSLRILRLKLSGNSDVILELWLVKNGFSSLDARTFGTVANTAGKKSLIAQTITQIRQSGICKISENRDRCRFDLADLLSMRITHHESNQMRFRSCD
jgi:hypothetical protein